MWQAPRFSVAPLAEEQLALGLERLTRPERSAQYEQTLAIGVRWGH